MLNIVLGFEKGNLNPVLDSLDFRLPTCILHADRTPALVNRLLMEVSHIPEGSCSKVITVSRCGETRFFPTGEIYYLESMRNLICVFGERGSFEFYGVLYKVERQIRSLGFFRISNSYIISMIHVRGVRSGYVELDNGKKISIGRKYRSDFKAALRESGILDLK